MTETQSNRTADLETTNTRRSFPGNTTKIEWTDKTWNTCTGCQPISQAARTATRLRSQKV